MKAKVTIVGAGAVGATAAQRLLEKGYADIVLVDIAIDLARGKALDMLQAGPVLGFDSRIKASESYEEAAGSDIVVITAGVPRKPGMSRDDLLFTNMNIVKKVTEEVARTSPESIIIVVTNPLDAMAQLTYWVSRFPRQRVLGMSGILDAARFRTFVAEELGVSVTDVTGYVMGGHGDTMVPIPRLSFVGGVPLTQLLSPEALARIVKRTREGGGEIVSLLKTGSAYYAPSAAAVQMVEAILLDRKQILPCSVYLDGEYDIRGVFMGVPVKLGKGGMEEIIQVELAPEERVALWNSAEAVREMVEKMRPRVLGG